MQHDEHVLDWLCDAMRVQMEAYEREYGAWVFPVPVTLERVAP